jgi:hypothetical protein
MRKILTSQQVRDLQVKAAIAGHPHQITAGQLARLDENRYHMAFYDVGDHLTDAEFPLVRALLMLGFGDRVGRPPVRAYLNISVEDWAALPGAEQVQAAQREYTR